MTNLEEKGLTELSAKELEKTEGGLMLAVLAIWAVGAALMAYSWRS